MAASAGYPGKIAVTATSTNPTSSDVLDNVRSSGRNRSRDELDTNVLGTVEKSFILGQGQTEVPLEVNTDSSSSPEGIISAAVESGATFYIHVMPNGTAGNRFPVKCSGFSESIAPDGVITRSYTIKSVGALASTTLS
jgi:hypothetical protein